MTEVVGELTTWRRIRADLARRQRVVGFVPTMGALHEGHASLFRQSRADNDVTVASIFVNPAQFNDTGDLAVYPRTPEADLAMLNALGVDWCLTPPAEAVYPDGYRYRVTESEQSRLLEGAHRPGHFDGVLTVVLKLIQLVRPARAYFGEKDWQQYQLVRGMAAALFLDVEIVGCPIVREADGLALSSRNVRLDPAARALAGRFAQRLAVGGPAEDIRADLEALGIEVQYVAEQDGRRLAAVVIGGVRLIDNRPIA